MTAPQSTKASPLLWVGLLAVAAVVVLLAFTTRDNAPIGGFADPDGTSEVGLRGFRLFVEEAGGDSRRNVGLPGDDIDVAVMALPIPLGIQFLDDPPEPRWEPLMDWVESGGTLLTSLDIPSGPLGGVAFVEGDEIVEPGLCTLEALVGVDEIRPLEHNPVVVENGDDSCFGEGGDAVVVVRQRGAGRIIRVATMGLFFNRAFDDADNAALAARLIRIDEGPTVGFLPQPPVFFEVDEDGEIVLDFNGDPVLLGSDGVFGGQTPGDIPIDRDGNPVGAGDDGLFDLVETRVIAMIVGLAAAALMYAVARGRRLGSPVVEPVPIPLPSSSYVDAVGRLYGRTDSPQARSSAILRHDLRTDLARRVGMAADSSASDLASAVVASDQRDAIVALLDGPAPTDDDAFLTLATQLIQTRDRIDRGGVSSLAHSEDISIARAATTRSSPTQSSTNRSAIVSERTTDG